MDVVRVLLNDTPTASTEGPSPSTQVYITTASIVTTVRPSNSTVKQLTSTQLLIIFLVVVFAVLILFLLIYYYFVKNMANEKSKRPTVKSTSGSISEEKQRNIFAHPERHLAVDHSLRASPSSATNTSSSVQQTTSAVGPNEQPSAVGQHSTTPSQALIHKQVEPPNQVAAPGNQMSNAADQQQQLQLNKQQQQQPTTRTQVTQKADKSLTRKTKSNSHSKRKSDGKKHSPLVGALAGIRDTIRESSSP